MQNLDICLLHFSVHRGHYILPYVEPGLNEVLVIGQGVSDPWGQLGHLFNSAAELSHLP
jgi:hypothetical protein